MSVTEEKLKRFESIIFSEVEGKMKEKIEAAEKYKKTALDEHRNSKLEEYFDYMQDQVKQIESDIKRRVSQAELSADRELLLYRNRIAEKVFSNVKEKLHTFTESEEYPAYLKERIDAALKSYAFSSAEVLVRKEDLSLFTEASFPCSEEKDIRLGGFILIDRENGLMADESFDSKLEALVPYFYRTSGLIIS